MTTDTTPPLPDDLIDELVDLLVDNPVLFSWIGEVIRRAAPAIHARRQLDNLPEVPEP